MVVFQGARSLHGGPPLDLDKEFDGLVTAYDGLEGSVRQRVRKPVVAPATEQSILEQLSGSAPPHIFWYSGHAERHWRHGVRLVFADGARVTPRQLADMLRRSGAVPPYAVFWACDTARGRAPAAAASQPALFASLREVGVLAMLAMQTQISDGASVAMAERLFRGLVHGQPFELAVASARADLLDLRLPATFPYDWATPVVWSAGQLVPAINWADSANSPALYQLFASTALAALGAADLIAPASESETTLAASWLRSRRLWVLGDCKAHRPHWLRTLRAILIRSPGMLLPVELRTGECWVDLREWADRVLSRILPGDQFPELLRMTVEAVRRDPIQGWKSLCDLPDLSLAVSVPRPPAPEWFWGPLSGVKGPVWVLSQEAPADRGAWAIDHFDTGGVAEETATAAIDAAPRLARALALLSAPAQATQLVLRAGPDGAAEAYNTWHARSSASVAVGGGIVLTATAEKLVRDRLLRSQADVTAGHRDCLIILGDVAKARKPEVRSQRIEHLIGAGMADEAVMEAERLLRDYDRADRPWAAALLLDRLERERLASRIVGVCKLIAGWAYLQCGDLTRAEFYLREKPVLALDRARRAALRAEIAKARGDRANCRHSLDEAIRICEEALSKPDPSGLPEGAPSPRHRLFIYRHDRARFLQYVEHDPKAAVKEYEELLSTAEQDQVPEADLAYLYRNYGEAMRTLAEQDHWDAWQRAEFLLNTARDLSRARQLSFLYPETLYQLARLAAKRGRPEEAANLLGDCKQAAVLSGHRLLLAIVDARLFWARYDAARPPWPAVAAEWAGIAERLTAFPGHGWAVRTLLDGRIRVARICAGPDPAKAGAELTAVRDELERRPTFDRGSDQRRAAVALAGLDVLAGRVGRPREGWAALLQKPWAREWLVKHELQSPDETWLWEG
jgi:tetratricopeptide (TPR) repeat protein